MSAYNIDKLSITLVLKYIFYLHPLLDDLLFELEKSGDGCTLDTNYYECVGYADDLKLLCP